MDTDETSENLEASGDTKVEIIPVKESAETAIAVIEQKSDTLNTEPNEPLTDNVVSTSSSSTPIPLAAPVEQPNTPIITTNYNSSSEAPPEPPNVEEKPTEPSAKELAEKAKKKDDEKLAMYKALAIKLKKELVKSRDELQRLKEDSSTECNALKGKVESLEEALSNEKQTNVTTIATLESKVKNLRNQLNDSEADFQSLQTEFEEYKIRASKIMQQNNPMLQSCSIKSFEDERYKKLKELNDEQKKQIENLSVQLSTTLERSKEHEEDNKLLREQLERTLAKLESFKTIDNKCELLSRENENLKSVLKQFRTKLKEPVSMAPESSVQNCDEANIDANATISVTKPIQDGGNTNTNSSNTAIQITAQRSDRSTQIDRSPSIDDRLEENSNRLSPSASVKDDSQTNSSSSFDGSTSGYVHIKPTPFEIISRSSVLEDAQNQIDNLTKAYLDSESTNSLLSEQVRALKEEIRRLQRGTERLDLAENLEYLKNVVFKFLSLDSGQAEQKQRLVPVISTVLKLSPEETAKLNSLAIVDKPSMASSFFKL